MAKGLRIDFKDLGIIHIRIEHVVVAKLCCILIVNIRAVGAFANLDTNISRKISSEPINFALDVCDIVFSVPFGVVVPANKAGNKELSPRNLRHVPTLVFRSEELLIHGRHSMRSSDWH